MVEKISPLQEAITQHSQALPGELQYSSPGSKVDCLTLAVDAANWFAWAQWLKESSDCDFQQLIDVCGVDYQTYGHVDWRTDSATSCSGYSRGRTVDALQTERPKWIKSRFAAVYHLLSLNQNHRLRVRVWVDEATMKVPSVVPLWPAAQWFEREAFDLFGIVFDGHPDLRRILTDYGFSGHPFRKDFPLIGEVEMHYDAQKKRCVYAPVSIQPRVLVPRVIRDDNRYRSGNDTSERGGT